MYLNACRCRKSRLLGVKVRIARDTRGEHHFPVDDDALVDGNCPEDRQKVKCRPMGRRAAALEQPGCATDERTGADRKQAYRSGRLCAGNRRLIREMSHQHSAPLLRVCQRFQPMMMRY
jgi:hypothetical protein